MVAGIEFGKEYAQICVKTENGKEPETLGITVGEEDTAEIFKKLLKLLKPYGNPEKIECLVFVLEADTEEQRKIFLDLAKKQGILQKRVRFLDKKESFCAYVFHQQGELLARHCLLVENEGGEQKLLLLRRMTGKTPPAAEVKEISGESIEDVLAVHGISSVFLVGDFTAEWMEHYLKILKKGRRVFAGKNLYVKGACYRAMEVLAEGKEQKKYLYLGEETLRASIALQGENESMILAAEAGKKWYEADRELEVLLVNGQEIEFVIVPADGAEKSVVKVPLDGLPKRPEKTTRLRISLTFSDTEHAHYTVRDLGFGELFAPTELVYEGELQWEQ